MRQILFLILVGLILTMPSNAQDAGTITDLFNTKCGICHTIGGGKLIGPDLRGVNDRHEESWLMDFIRSSQKMINGGDPTAIALFEENNKMLMPDPMISDEDISSLLSYIKEKVGSGTLQPAASILGDVTIENMESGRNYFEGHKLFTNGGPSCISCHNDMSSYFFSENSYSTKDVRTSFALLGEAGVKAILSNPPYPVMNKAFEGHSLEENEIRDLMTFLRDRGRSSAPTARSSGYFLYGLGGALLLFFLYSGLWFGRKSKSVNHKIYKRQIRSAN